MAYTKTDCGKMIITYEDLIKIRKKYKNKKIVLGLGAFDLFHYEHLRYLVDAKKQGDVLVVAVKCDEFVRSKGKDRPIICEEQRASIVDSLRCVDYTIIANRVCNKEKWQDLSENAAQDEWFSEFYDIFDMLRPDVLYYEIKPELESARQNLAVKLGYKLVSRKRTAIVTTSVIVEKIKGNKDGN